QKTTFLDTCPKTLGHLQQMANPLFLFSIDTFLFLPPPPSPFSIHYSPFTLHNPPTPPLPLPLLLTHPPLHPPPPLPPPPPSPLPSDSPPPSRVSPASSRRCVPRSSTPSSSTPTPSPPSPFLFLRPAGGASRNSSNRSTPSRTAPPGTGPSRASSPPTPTP